jgi:2-polyprenyl-3-methyl-5-hydroxy-6-metoxy-1,4-benzoquinol methylase
MNFIHSVRKYLRHVVCPLNNLIDKIPENSKLFDLGCGTGAFLLDALTQRNLKLVGGSETNEKLLNYAKNLLSKHSSNFKSDYFIESAMPPNFINQFDVITLIDVLHHIPIKEQHSYLSNLYSNMNQNAIFILKDIDAASPLAIFNKIHDFVFSGNGYQEQSFRNIKNQCELIGFKHVFEEKIRKLWYPHYLLIMKK